MRSRFRSRSDAPQSSIGRGFLLLHTIALIVLVLGACARFDLAKVLKTVPEKNEKQQRSTLAASHSGSKEPARGLSAIAGVSPAGLAEFHRKESSLERANEPPFDVPTAESVRAWAQVDPSAAAVWAAQLHDGGIRRASYDQIAIAWANQDLEAAVKWFKALPSDETKAGVGIALGYEASRTDPARSLDLLALLEQSPERDEALLHAMTEWASLNAAEAAAWAQQIPDPDLRNKFLARVAIVQAEQDGPTAAELVARGLESGEDQAWAAVAVAQRWAQTDPDAASEWVSLFPASPTRFAAMESLSQITREDLGAAREQAQLSATKETHPN